MLANESLSDIPSLSNKFNGEDLNNISISHQDIIDQLNKLNPNKSCGPNKIHPRVIKEIKDGLILSLFYYTHYINHYVRVPYQLVGKKQ